MSRTGFNIAFVGAFAATLLAAILASTLAKPARAPGAGLDQESVSRAPASWIDPSTPSATEAKAKRQFWASDERGQGVALDALRNPRLLEEILPGYGSVGREDPVWTKYFSREFDTDTWLPSLNWDSRSQRVAYLSFAGCLDLWQEKGADVVVFGASETARLIAPALIARELGDDLTKILKCTRGNFNPANLMMTLESLKASPPPAKARWAILGYPYWNAYRRSPVLGRAKIDHARLLESRSRPPWIGLGPMSLFAKREWDDLFPVTLKSLTERQPLTPNGALALGEIRQDEREAGFRFSTSVLERANPSSSIRELAALAKPFSRTAEGVETRDCELLPESANELELLLDSLLRYSERVLLVLPPVTELHLATYPDCFPRTVRRMLETASERRGGRVRFLPLDREEPGFDYADFVLFTKDPGVAKIDPDHVNFAGARKAAAAISGALSEP